jgi:glycosyltransferase involved in cell wall biosynthesis
MELLKQKCNENNIDLVLLYGKDDKLTFNDAEIEWGIKIKNYRINIFGKSFYFQPVLKHLKNADLIIVEQATKFFINYYLWILNLLGVYKLAFWGHGKNLNRENSFSVSELVKDIMTKRVSHFFAYNDFSKTIVEKIGLPASKITAVNNTIDVESILDDVNKYDMNNLSVIKKDLGIESENICLYVGGIYKEKRIPFLLEAIKIVKKTIRDFEFIFIGDGPEKHLVLQAVNENSWIHYYGVKKGNEKIPYFLMSKFFLMPGLVGLALIDSFAFGLPLVTTDCKIHSPEIDYLKDGINGIITADNLAEYSNEVIRLLQNEDERQQLAKECKESAGKYTVKEMTKRFFDGIQKCI